MSVRDCARFEFLSAVLNACRLGFYVVSTGKYLPTFRRTSAFIFRVKQWNFVLSFFVYSLTLNLKPLRSSETSVTFLSVETAWCHKRLEYFEYILLLHMAHSIDFVFGINRLKATTTFVTSVSLSPWKNSAPTGRIFIEFHIWEIFENLWAKFEFH
jgi:hypothetical protein